MGTGSWLCDENGRRRLVENNDRVRPQRIATFALLLLVLVATAPWVGWWPLAPLAVAAVGYRWSDSRLARSERPERPFVLAWVLSQVCIGASAALSGGPHSEALVWLVIPIVTISARLTMRGLFAAVVVTELVLLGATVGVDPEAVLHGPQTVLYPAVAVASAAILSAALMKSDLHHRSKSVIDPLTQMLNRGALIGRAGEIGEQSSVTGDPVALVVLDLDNFKAVNDTHGHPVGDAVLRDVAYRIRKELRAFDLAYRLGGEEFVVLLPGSDERGAMLVAERLREVICAEPIAGLDITVSCGVAASPANAAFDFDTVFALADLALYGAKRAGRNRIAGTLEVPVPELALTHVD